MHLLITTEISELTYGIVWAYSKNTKYPLSPFSYVINTGQTVCSLDLSEKLRTEVRAPEFYSYL